MFGTVYVYFDANHFALFLKNGGLLEVGFGESVKCRFMSIHLILMCVYFCV